MTLLFKQYFQDIISYIYMHLYLYHVINLNRYIIFIVHSRYRWCGTFHHVSSRLYLYYLIITFKVLHEWIGEYGVNLLRNTF